MIVADLMLDLDVFQGPFDLLLALVMREEIELAELRSPRWSSPIEHAYDDGCSTSSRRASSSCWSPRCSRSRCGCSSRARRTRRSPERRGGRGRAARPADAVPPLRRRRALADRPRRRRAPLFRAGPAPLAPRPQPEVVPFCEDPWALHAAVGRLLTPPPRDRPLRRATAARAREPLPGRVPQPACSRRAFAFDEAVAGSTGWRRPRRSWPCWSLKTGEACPSRPRCSGRSGSSATGAERCDPRAIA